MSAPVSSELLIFLWSICGGILLGFIFDIFRIKRRVIRTGILVTSIEDILYWVFAAIVAFLTLYLSNDGQIRGYSIIGCILGAVFYLSAVSPIVLNVSVTVINFVVNLVKFIYKVILVPIKFIVKVLKPIISFIRLNSVKTSKTCFNNVKRGSRFLYLKGFKRIQLKNKKKHEEEENKTDI